MKLASLKQGGRDGTLIVVDRNMEKAVAVPDIAATMQAALDNWSESSGALKAVYTELQSGRGEDAFRFDPANAAAPLDRTSSGSANGHARFAAKGRGQH